MNKTLMITYINFWTGFTPEKSHLHNYFKYAFLKVDLNLKIIPPSEKKADLIIASVFGSPNVIKDYTGFKILYSGENINHRRYAAFQNESVLRSLFDLFLGFDRQEDNFKIRIPVWLIHHDFYLKHDSFFYQKIKANRLPKYSAKKSICFVARNDAHGTRTLLVKKIQKKNIDIDCPSLIGKNMVSIEESGLTKYEFLIQYYFNLCPENSYSDGYFTEKILDAVAADCIPIYWGDREMEQDLLNINRIIYFKLHQFSPVIHLSSLLFKKMNYILNYFNSSFEEVLKQIQYLLNNPNELKKFYEQPIFTQNAINVIDAYLNKFDRIVERFLKISKFNNE